MAKPIEDNENAKDFLENLASANAISNTAKAQLAALLGFEVYSDLALANAGIGAIGIPFFNTTSNAYESTTDIS